MRKRQDLAIIGIGCRYPGGVDNSHTLWEMLCQGRDGFTDVPKERWTAERFTDSSGKVAGQMAVQQAAFVRDEVIKDFDTEFFGIHPGEADVLDPQQRMLLEVSWEAFEDAGIRINDIRGSDVGVYVGGFNFDNSVLRAGVGSSNDISQFSATASTLVMLSNRLSYFFDFHGPSLTIDTACSSSMVALNSACQDIWAEKTPLALVGGVNALLNPNTFLVMAKGGFLSPDSRSKAFDAGANGYARGEGAGVVIIKPLAYAEKDNDRIYAIIKAVDVNQDGRTPGIASPNQDAQKALIVKTFSDQKLNAEDVVLLEAHGTGTKIGDRIEVSALSEALGKRKGGQPRYLGSVKGNIGHQEAGAGIAGIIKVALCLHKDKAVPQANFSDENPVLSLGKRDFHVPENVLDLPEANSSKLACVNSFGYGGTNAHAVLSQYAAPKNSELKDKELDGRPQLFAISAKTPEALSLQGMQMRQFVQRYPETDLPLLANDLAGRRTSLDCRTSFVASSLKEVLDGLSKIENDQAGYSTSYSDVLEGPVFIYTGMGPQWWGMGHQLFENEPVFRNAVKEADDVFESHAGWSVLSEMLKSEQKTRMARNEVAQPANFVLQHGLTALLADREFHPSIIVGHSVGEVAAAHAAGALSLSDATKIAFHRSRLQQTRAGKGRMLATGLTLKQAEKVASEHAGKLSISAINSWCSIALAGDEETLRFVASELEEAGIFQRLINGEVAYHSHQMDDLEAEIYEVLADTEPGKPNKVLYSTVTGSRVTKPMHDAAYWWKNVRQPVRFEAVIQKLARQGKTHYLEIGPSRVLSGAIRQGLSKNSKLNAVSVATLIPGEDEQKSLLTAMGQLWREGCLLPNASQETSLWTNLPKYPWQRKRHWKEPEQLKSFLHAQSDHLFLGVRQASEEGQWVNTLNSHANRMLRGHVINNRPIFPAAAYIESFLAASRALGKTNEVHSLANVAFTSVMTLPAKDTVVLKTNLTDSVLSLQAKPVGEKGKWRTYSQALLLDQHASPHGFVIPATEEPEKYETLEKTEIYGLLRTKGLQYESSYQPLQNVKIRDSHLIGQLELPEDCDKKLSTFVPPSLVDGGLQMLALAFPDANGAMLPVGVRKVHLFADKLPHKLIVHGLFETERQGDKKGRLLFVDELGKLVMVLSGIETKLAPVSAAPSEANQVKYFTFQWSEEEIKASEEPFEIIESAVGNPHSLLAERFLKAQQGIGFVEHKTAGALLVSPQTGAQKPDAQSDFQFLKVIEKKSEGLGSKSLIICTQNAWAVTDGDISDPSQASIWGAVRSFAREKRSFSYVLADVDGDEASIQALLRIAGRLEAGSEIAVRQGSFYRHYLEKADKRSNRPSVAAHKLEATASVKLEEGSKLGIDRLLFRSVPRRCPASNEMEIEVEAVSINFKDVLKVLGVLTDQTLKNTYFKNALGMEATGQIVRMGNSIHTDLKVGDKVVLLTPDGCLRSHVTLNPNDTWVQDARDYYITQDQLSCVPVAFFTAHYALLDAGRLERGETVLLQSASGGVGLAALQVAQGQGAKVIATAGSEEKRDFLRKNGVEHVFASRSLDFENQVLAVTGERGVDVVLSFLPGELMQSGIRVLAPFGRFVELGKADIGRDGPLRLGEFERNLSFHAVDLDHMMSVRKELLWQLSSEIQENFKKRVYKPLPHQTYPASEIKELFKELADGKHIGKRVVNMHDLPNHAAPPLGADRSLRADAAYLVTGGYSGLGLETAKWLVSQSVGSVILVGRNIRDNPEIQELEKRARKNGVLIETMAADISDHASVTDLISSRAANEMSLRGIFHAAGVLDDRKFADQTADSFAEAYNAKAIGAWNLHDAGVNEELELDCFVLFSSISAMLGNPGQTNYSGANSYLDGLAEFRRSKGLPATSISWGAVGGAGMVARDASVERMLSLFGIGTIPVHDAVSHMFSTLPSCDSNISLSRIDWKTWRMAAKPKPAEPIAILIDGERLAEAEGPIMTRLQLMPEEEAQAALLEIVRERLAEVIRRPAEAIPTSQPLSGMALDSLSLAELLLSLEEEIGMEIEQNLLDPEGSLEDLSSALFNRSRSIVDTDDSEIPGEATK